MAVIKIKELAKLQSGLPLGSRNFVEEGDAWVIQGNSIIRADAVVRGHEGIDFVDPALDSIVLSRGPSDGLRQAEIPNLSDEKIIQPGDVLFRARHAVLENLKAYVPFEKEGLHLSAGKPHVITNTLIKLRPNSKVLPRYLAWAINNFRSELQLQSSRSGAASIVTINIKQLAEVSLPIPDLKVQDTILAAFEEIEKTKAIAEATNYAANELLCGLAQKHS